MVDVKICGIRSEDDLKAVAAAGATWTGLVFFPKSPRHLNVDDAAALRQAAERLSSRPQLVALTVDADDGLLDDIMARVQPDMLQCHGQEDPARISAIKTRYGRPVIKAIRVHNEQSLIDAKAFDGHADMMLFDSAPVDAVLPGGTGHAFDWGLMRQWQGATPWMLAGGLTPENVAQAIAESGAKAVDVSSGVEDAPGIKNPAAIQRFVLAAQSART
jgi:phosphoribosylanthranilate isomerase